MWVLRLLLCLSLPPASFTEKALCSDSARYDGVQLSQTDLALQQSLECMHGFLQLSSSVSSANESFIQAQSGHGESGSTSYPFSFVVPLLLMAPALAFVLSFAWVLHGPTKSLTRHLDSISAEAEKEPEKLVGETFVDLIFSKAISTEKSAPALKAWSEASGVEKTMTFEELAYAVQRAANSLAKVGVAHGDRVAFFCKGTLDFWVTFLGAQCVGATPVLLNWRQSMHNLQGMMEDCGVSWLVVGALHEARADLLEVIPASVKSPILLLDGELAPKGAAMQPLLLDLSDSEERGKGRECRGTLRSAKLTRSDEAVIFFTSGSTSRPKPVLHSYATLMWAAENYVFPNGTSQTLAFLPNFHVIMTSHNFLIPLARGICVAIHAADDRQPLTAEMLLKAVADIKPQVVDTVPFIMEQWSALRQEEVKYLAQCAVVQSGGASLSGPVARALLEKGVPVREQYGQTEAGGMQLATVPGAQANEMMVMMPPWKMATVSLDGVDEGELVIQGIQSSAIGNLSKGALVPGTSKLEAAGHRTGDVFRWTTTASGQKGLVHTMRTDDTVLLSTGEMFNPVPIERTISDSANGLDELKGALIAVLGKNRASPILVVEAPEGCRLDAETALQKLKPAIDAANAAEVEYARIKPFHTCFLSPTSAVRLPRTAKGNFIRGQSEQQLTNTLDMVEAEALRKHALVQKEKAQAAGFKSVEEFKASTGGAGEDMKLTDSLGVNMKASRANMEIHQVCDNMKCISLVSVLIVHFYFISREPQLAPWVEKILEAATETAGVGPLFDMQLHLCKNCVWADPMAATMWTFFFAFGTMDGIQDGPSRKLEFFSSRTFATVIVIVVYKLTRSLILAGDYVSYSIDGNAGIGTRSIWFVYVVLWYRAMVRVMQMLRLPAYLQIGLTAAGTLQYMFAGSYAIYLPDNWLLNMLLNYESGIIPGSLCGVSERLPPYGRLAPTLDSCQCIGSQYLGKVCVSSTPTPFWDQAYDIYALAHVVSYYHGEAVVSWFLKRRNNIASCLQSSNVEHDGTLIRQLLFVLACSLAAVGLNLAVLMTNWTPVAQWKQFLVQACFVTSILIIKIMASVGGFHFKRIGGSALGIYLLHRYFAFGTFNWLINVSDLLFKHSGHYFATQCLQLVLLIGWPFIFCYIFGPTLQALVLKPVTWLRGSLSDV